MRVRGARFLLAATAAVAGWLSVQQPAAAATSEQVLYDFCSQGGQGCTGGYDPLGGLIRDNAGNLYGTTHRDVVTGGGEGSTNGSGEVFMLSPTGGGYAFSVLYSFCAQPNCTDGALPTGTLAIDPAGNLYGTTNTGGAPNHGVVFRLAPSGGGYAYTVLYSFCPGGGNCTDGVYPNDGLVIDGAGNLYGTTQGGGARGQGAGVVFTLSPNGNSYNYSVLYSFCAQPFCIDGQYPQAGLIIDQQGNLYGTTENGGVSFSSGAVFELSPNGGGYNYSVLYSFCSQGGSHCTDGQFPVAGLVLDGAGNLYGTTEAAGANNSGGTVFRLTPAGGGTWTETTLYSFCAQTGCGDGKSPYAGLVIDPAGNLYGTTRSGGANAKGAVFRLSPSGSTWTETVLYSLCSQTGCPDGNQPSGGLVIDLAGNLYGMALGGNNLPGCVTTGCGVVFEITGIDLSTHVMGDLFGTGRADILWRDVNSGDVSATELNGGTLVGAYDFGATPTNWAIVGLANFYGAPGPADLLWRNQTDGTVAISTVSRSGPTGTFGVAAVTTDWEIAGVGNFFQSPNGKDAILWRNTVTGAVALWKMDGANLVGAYGLGSVGTDWQIAGVGDFFGSGQPAILWRNTVSGAVAIWQIVGIDGTVTGYYGVATVGADWQIAGVGDFFGTGQAAILWFNATSGYVGIWQMNGGTVTGAFGVAAAPAGWRIAGVGDFDGDGKADIFWRNPGTTQYGVWLMNGASVTGATVIGTYANTATNEP